MVKFRQLIIPGDVGRDVIAVKIGLHHMGFKTFSVPKRFTRTANKNFEAAIRAIQREKKLHVDGIYGEKTHDVVARHFDKYANWLYTHATFRHRNEYTNPFLHCRGLEIDRIDEGVDYHGYGPIAAFGDFEIVGLGGSGWPGAHYINARVRSGRHTGKFYYIAEAINPVVRVGQLIKAGQTICIFGWAAAPGLYPGIETGWGSPITNLTWAAVSGQLTPPPFNDTPPGLAFARFLHAIGAPAPPVGPGPEFV